MATHTVGRDVPSGALKAIPVPRMNPSLTSRIEALVQEYTGIVQDHLQAFRGGRTAERVLLEIDAAILEGYDLPPRLERSLLDYFNGHGERRPVSHAFGDYFPADFRPCFALADYLSDEFRHSTAKEFKTRREQPSEDTVRALEATAKAEKE